VQAKIVDKQDHRMSHAERLFPSNCQLSKDVELDAIDWPTKTDNKIKMRLKLIAEVKVVADKKKKVRLWCTMRALRLGKSLTVTKDFIC
jgi:hypothetical protein